MHPSRYLIGLGILMLLAGGVTAAEPAGFQPHRYIGYWLDGSGVMRDATPVTEWSDFVYKPQAYKDKHGKEKKRLGPDRSTGDQAKNIVWQVDYYNYCNGGMIMVGGKLYGLTDRGGLGFNVDRAAGFIGAPLTCFDPATGEELWTVDLNHWDLVPDGEQVVEVLKEFNKRYPAVYGAYYELGGKLGTKGKTKLTQETYEPLRDAFNAVAEKKAPETLEECLTTNIKPRGYIQTSFDGRVIKEYFPTIHQMRDRIRKAGGYTLDPWFGQMAHLGINMQTPVSDGKHLYISTSFGAVFCVDLDGQLVWKHWFGAGWDRGWAIASPVLCGDKLIVHGVDPKKSVKQGNRLRVAMDKNTGQVLWTQAEISQAHYQPAPIVLSLPVAGNDGDRVEVLLCGDGDVLRVEDGKRLATGLGGGGHARPWAVEGTTIALVNAVADGGAFKGTTQFDEHKKCLVVFEIVAPSRDEVAGTLLWTDKSCTSYSNGIILKDGRLHWWDNKKQQFFIKDAKTGKELATCKAPVGKLNTRTRCFHTPVIAGQFYIALDQSGSAGVIDLGADGVSPKPAGFSMLSPPDKPMLAGKFHYGAQPLVSGNRIFLRGNEKLYCIGDPSVEMVLSEVHR